MANLKNFCNVHRFNYLGTKCPFCEQDRINSLAHRFNKNTDKSKSVKAEREITEADLNKLKSKFNGK